MTKIVVVVVLSLLVSPLARHEPRELTRVAAVVGNEPVLWLHGWINLIGGCLGQPGDPGIDADRQAAPYRGMLRSEGYSGQVLGVQYYCGDNGSFDIRTASGALARNRQYTNGVPIETLAKDLVFKTWETYGRRGLYVRIAAHSMGGLIAGYALARAGRKGWPPFLVKSVVTFSTPWGGTDRAPTQGWCGGTVQCKQMMPGSTFIRRLSSLRLPTGVNVVTEGGGPADTVASFKASTRPDAKSRVNYYSSIPVRYSHVGYIRDTSSDRDVPCRINGVKKVCFHSLRLAARLGSARR